MFIFDFIKKYWYKTYKEPKILKNEECIKQYDITDNDEDISNYYEVCEHVFMHVDSTGEILACIKCGLIAKKNEIYKENFF